ncbi:hypothetical protein HOK51_03945 [Candidatus Woesearchaeota archaeon]|jgi:hypothetical protein|nr:hypothetical protein [Candidatus Woesearchaeota archaeon]MBT6518975.1 hypothetical protein [Candidatus Woesearchaeota archaeon]MBT7368340.1 hypothetical protein [Candidatus Woesearchaeota archaeon]
MSESQSRYSIVERLTQRKLDIMTAKFKLKEELIHKEQKISELRQDLENWDKDISEDISRERRQKERLVEQAIQIHSNFSERMADKEEIFDKKIIAIESALKSLEEISKTSQAST